MTDWTHLGFTTDGDSFFTAAAGPSTEQFTREYIRRMMRDSTPPPPKNVEIVVEIDGQRLPVEVSSDLRDKLLAAGRTRKAQYEARDRARREQEQRRAATTVGPRTVNDAITQLRALADDHNSSDLRKVVRRAKRKTHPDTGGTNRDFQTVSDCERLLKQAGRLP